MDTSKTNPQLVLSALMSALMIGDSDGARIPGQATNAIDGLLNFSSAEGQLEGSEANKTIVNIAILILKGAGYNDDLVADGEWGPEGEKALLTLRNDLFQDKED